MNFLPGARGRSARHPRRGGTPHPKRSFAGLSTALLGLIVVASQANCGAGGDDKDPTAVAQNLPPMLGGGNGDMQATGGTFVPEDCMGSQCDIANPVTSLPAPPGCGNGTLEKDEACDDGNKNSGDGCSSNCLATEKGFSCPTAGQACRQIALCGDGLVADSEQCDDGNKDDGDGCSQRCKIERGKKCSGTPSVCTDTVCGDGNIEGSESCDDGNRIPFDGCSETCQKEPDCENGPCTSTCGDGLVLNEECDDGNLKDGDGCSSKCTIESGFTCPGPADCERGANGECVVRVSAIFRDFSDDQPNFGGNTCTKLQDGAIAARLDQDGKPALSTNTTAIAGACLTTPGDTPAQDAANFARWYRDRPGDPTEVTKVGSLVLYDNGAGGYVNRYGANGEQWTYTLNNSQSQMGATLAACQATCLDRGINGQAPLAGQQLRCADQCRTQTDAIQQYRTGDLQRAQQALTQAMAANPADPVAVADAQAAVDAAQAELATLQAAADTCTTTCQNLLDARVQPCVDGCHPCDYPLTGFCYLGDKETLDGTPLFFPVDDITTGPTATFFPAKIPDQYGRPPGSMAQSVFNGFPLESAVIPGAGPHNFYFTTEVEYWFKYTADMRATLTFLGDDDVWVFLNGNLAVDLGGLHVPSTGSVTIDAPAGRVATAFADGRVPAVAGQVTNGGNPNGTPAQFGLQEGNVYKISIFHAERQIDGSSFQLTLAGFDAKPSDCQAVCGDGVISFGEECDNGIEGNIGGYGECDANCKLGPFCGDKNKDVEWGETCDVGPGGDATCRGCKIFQLR